ncbi:hypothetical protein PYW08_012312 [Mythimna loreyi]|uniref:Uncharacterized protein n=1 Tax=Mythimna loreyi TaxID=667449 RepID=A0ACC2Q138_9NEOP|nr:hypothetical protein PYW08_012312 [Mythimna loreyi]
MKHSVFYILMVIEAIRCENLEQSKKIKLVNNCINVQCDHNGDPQCVRIRHYGRLRTYHVRDCGLRYLECKGVKVTNCTDDTDEITDSTETEDMTGTPHTRSIRTTPPTKSKPRKTVKKSKDNNTKHIKKSLKRYRKKQHLTSKKDDSNKEEILNTEPLKGQVKVLQRFKKKGLHHMQVKTRAILTTPPVKSKLRKDVEETPQHNRVKRNAILDPGVLLVEPVNSKLRKVIKESNDNNTKHVKKSSRKKHKKHRLRFKTDGSKIKRKKLKIKHLKGFKKQARQAYTRLSSETETDYDNNEQKKLKKGIGGYMVKASNGMSPKSVKLEPKALMPPQSDELWMKHAAGSQIDSVPKRTPPVPLFKMFPSKESTNNMADYDTDNWCPTKCPALTAMVCARCQHGIFRTFSSVCHVKMFECSNPNEVMTLVSRVPCIMSSPLISEKGMQPQGLVKVDEEDDLILRYIKCRDAGLIDVRIPLLRKKKNKKKGVPGKGALRQHRHRPHKRTQDKVYTYNYINKFNTWYDAKFACEHSNARLFYPSSSKQAQTVFNQFFKIQEVKNRKYPDFIFVGIYVRMGRDFVTIDGKPISEVYVNWAEGQPDNNNAKEYCVAMNSRHQYYDVDCDERLSFICMRTEERIGLNNSKRQLPGGIEDNFENSIEDDGKDNNEDDVEDNNEDNDEDNVEDYVEDNKKDQTIDPRCIFDDFEVGPDRLKKKKRTTPSDIDYTYP